MSTPFVYETRNRDWFRPKEFVCEIGVSGFMVFLENSDSNPHFGRLKWPFFFFVLNWAIDKHRFDSLNRAQKAKAYSTAHKWTVCPSSRRVAGGAHARQTPPPAAVCARRCRRMYVYTYIKDLQTAAGLFCFWWGGSNPSVCFCSLLFITRNIQCQFCP